MPLSNSELINSQPSDLLDFKTGEDILCEFFREKDREANKHQLKDIKILLSYYSYYNYSGDCFVLFTQNNRLYTVEAQHCSCYGLEGFWTPEEVTVDELVHLYFKGNFSKQPWSKSLAKLLNCIEDSTKNRLEYIRNILYGIEIFVLNHDGSIKLNPDLGNLTEDVSLLLQSFEINLNFSNLYELNNYVHNRLNSTDETHKYLNTLQTKKYQQNA
jgi:hypothetical protein